MAVTYTGVMKAINKLTKPMQEKVLKKLGLSTKGLPGRTSKKDGITVGKDRVKIEKKIDKLNKKLDKHIQDIWTVYEPIKKILEKLEKFKLW